MKKSKILKIFQNIGLDELIIGKIEKNSSHFFSRRTGRFSVLRSRINFYGPKSHIFDALCKIYI